MNNYIGNYTLPTYSQGRERAEDGTNEQRIETEAPEPGARARVPREPEWKPMNSQCHLGF